MFICKCKCKLEISLAMCTLTLVLHWGAERHAFNLTAASHLDCAWRMPPTPGAACPACGVPCRHIQRALLQLSRSLALLQLAFSRQLMLASRSSRSSCNMLHQAASSCRTAPGQQDLHHTAPHLQLLLLGRRMRRALLLQKCTQR
jgi:hypothetical protein